MRVELVSVGTEILLGDIVNTNAHYLSKRLAELGVSVTHQVTVGDNAERLKDALGQALSRSDMVIATGGLGPTPDDLTKEACAEFFGIPLVPDRESLEEIENYFAAKGLAMPECNKKQAMLPESCCVMKNENGTAPGCIMEKDGKYIAVLPGPPGEMKPMFENSLLPFLKRFSSGTIKSRSVRIFGVGESAMSERVSDLLGGENPTVAPYAKSGESLLRVTAKAESEEEAEKLLLPVVEDIKNRFGDSVYGVDCESIEQAVINLLIEKGIKVASAESCTAGLISKRLTDISGASEAFPGGVVSYSNDVKQGLLGVNKEHLMKYGAVSPVVAAEMALGAVKATGADAAVSVTGIADLSAEQRKSP